MLRVAANIVIGLFIAAIGVGLWRGRIGGAASVGALERARDAREELKRINMMEEVGGKVMDLDFLDREWAVSARLAWAEYDSASNEAGRAAAVDGHLQRMTRRALKLRIIFDVSYPATYYAKTNQHLITAQLWARLVHQ